MGLDNIDLINTAHIKQLLDNTMTAEEVNGLADSFRNSEPKATDIILDEIQAMTSQLSGRDLKNIGLEHISNHCWLWFLIGYHIGKDTHSYKIEEINNAN